jgi:hypothetical protein
MRQSKISKNLDEVLADCSERTALRLSDEMRRWSAQPVSGPTPPTCTVHQVVSYLGYTGRDANLFGEAALDPLRTFSGYTNGGSRQIQLIDRGYGLPRSPRLEHPDALCFRQINLNMVALVNSTRRLSLCLTDRTLAR